MRELFRITEPYSYQQYKLINNVLRKHNDVTVVVYQSNWKIVIACTDKHVAYVVLAEIATWGNWEYEVRQGRKHAERVYIKVDFNRE